MAELMKAVPHVAPATAHVVPLPPPTATWLSSAVPEPLALSEYEFTPVKSTLPTPSTFSRRLKISVPGPPLVPVPPLISEPAKAVSPLASKRNPAVQYPGLPVQLLLAAAVRAFTPMKTSCDPFAVDPPSSRFPSLDTYTVLFPLSRFESDAVPNVSVAVPSVAMVYVAPVTCWLVGWPEPTLAA